jgi:DNA-binding NtrC family response regulator
LRTAERIAATARTDLPVLITGETGTGKELFARAIHFMSRRRNHPFIPVDCGGIPDHLFENELFGHVRGAFTDAHTEQRGLAAVAEGGTLFLDEVESLPLAAQAKLLRFLQERQFKALGSERWAQADVRIVAATNRDLVKQTAEKEFRPDLYFRLDVLRLELPPLRERPEDIPLLARYFLAQHEPAGRARSFSPAALRRLTSYHWPGNVRELLNVIQRAIVFSKGAQIDACEIVLSQTTTTDRRDFRTAREETIESFERAFVQELLQRHQGNVTHAAKEAGKERRAFGRLIKKYGLRAGACAAGQS